MLTETFLIYSALHTQIFLEFLYVNIGPSTSTKKNKVSFLFQFFPPLPIYHLVLLSSSWYVSLDCIVTEWMLFSVNRFPYY